mmetsp:Transcript_14932/g.43069  ORF Transcript_14932/g.43069 Transcript_14932/m.43069 type:complete len:203 (+) Transcript_14932:1052-1660(+)
MLPLTELRQLLRDGLHVLSEGPEAQCEGALVLFQMQEKLEKCRDQAHLSCVRQQERRLQLLGQRAQGSSRLARARERLLQPRAQLLVLVPGVAVGHPVGVVHELPRGLPNHGRRRGHSPSIAHRLAPASGRQLLVDHGLCGFAGAAVGHDDCLVDVDVEHKVAGISGPALWPHWCSPLARHPHWLNQAEALLMPGLPQAAAA